jgi:hypothetical protein
MAALRCTAPPGISGLVYAALSSPRVQRSKRSGRLRACPILFSPPMRRSCLTARSCPRVSATASGRTSIRYSRRHSGATGARAHRGDFGVACRDRARRGRRLYLGSSARPVLDGLRLSLRRRRRPCLGAAFGRPVPCASSRRSAVLSPRHRVLCATMRRCHLLSGRIHFCRACGYSRACGARRAHCPRPRRRDAFCGQRGVPWSDTRAFKLQRGAARKVGRPR